MRVRVFYHDKCFDGACSASLFTRFHRECIARGASYEYHGLVHRAGALFDESEFTGDENAIVDFKYSASPRITWWFDHHQSAFLDARRITRTSSPASAIRSCAAHKFFDPNYTSCTSFLAHIAKTRYGFDTAPVAELIHWADIVDGAKYESPEAAVEMAAPAMKLTLIIESTQDPGFIPRLIPLLTEMPLAEILKPAVCGDRLPPLLERHQQALELIRSRAEERDGTIFFDITDHPARGIQQVHPVLSVSERDVLDRLVEVEFPHQGCRGIESVDQDGPGKDGEPGADLRALRRRRPRARGSHQLSAGQGSRRAQGSAGDCCGAASDETGSESAS